MKQCWDSNPNNRPIATRVLKFIRSFIDSYRNVVNDALDFKKVRLSEIEKQFKAAEEYRKSRLILYNENERSTIHPQAFYTSRLLNQFTKDLPKNDNINNNSVEVIDFTNL
ncbi:unnamed protein product [Rhizophagus irregularis]|uniref:Serine-threonine/tyrosine-protein kinase catalytic domain-containing protein n=1 Tax=Rhizophagus irregularis TaxID=588596 RepID=A0A915ZJ31_9GLOM|nr:unnamed protein product [Rhizophagus irregularis]CAB5379382.1 unnamed protein product [Rhizophagus irregularis]